MTIVAWTTYWLACLMCATYPALAITGVVKPADETDGSDTTKKVAYAFFMSGGGTMVGDMLSRTLGVTNYAPFAVLAGTFVGLLAYRHAGPAK